PTPTIHAGGHPAQRPSTNGPAPRGAPGHGPATAAPAGDRVGVPVQDRPTRRGIGALTACGSAPADGGRADPPWPATVDGSAAAGAVTSRQVANRDGGTRWSSRAESRWRRRRK